MGRQKRKEYAFYAVLAGTFLLITGAYGSGEKSVQQNAKEMGAVAEKAVAEPEYVPAVRLYAGIFTKLDGEEYEKKEKNKDILVAAANRGYFDESDVYSFLQGPKSWGEGRAWSGEWSNQYVRGNYFGNFGCGLCCMANIYSTFSGHTCSPWDMFLYAREVSGYTPTKKIGAIGWGDMKTVMRKCGFDAELYTKPQDYETFRDQVRSAKSVVVLVSSHDDNTYWKKTGGHYVNISLYKEDTDEVFLADPADPDGNRNYIPLRYVYDALKTVSKYQYLLVNGYSEEQNQWKQDGIDEAWVAP